MPSATIKLFLVHGDAKRLRTAELSNWTGKAIAVPRSELDGALSRDEAQKSGVYFLTGVDPDTGRASVYVGEAESIRDRLRAHLERDDWNHLTYFVSKDENLTKGHVRYLEGRLIDQARTAGRANVLNGQSSGSKLPESDREDMEIFLERVHQLLPVLGADFLLAVGSAPVTSDERVLLFCEIKGLRATGRLIPSGFLVLKDSDAASQLRPSANQYPFIIELRNKLLTDGTLVPVGDRLRFTKDTEFGSPSAAAGMVHGGTANGLVSWRTKAGKTLKDLEAT